MDASKPTVLLVLSTVHGNLHTPAWQDAKKKFNFILYDCPSIDTFCERLKPGGPYSKIDAIFRTGWLKAGPFGAHRLFEGAPLACFPPTLKYIGCCGHGYDAADIESLTRMRIAYANTPNTNTEAVANTALFLILNTYRYFTLAEHCARVDTWEDSREIGNLAVDPQGQVLGVVGMGDIGLAIAKKAGLALGMKVHYHNRRRRPDAERMLAALLGDGHGVKYHDTFEELLEAVDCLCLACPLTPETKHIVSAPSLERLRAKKIRIVNIARGGLIDEDSLLEAMERGQVVGVGLDVHAHEPGINPRLKDNLRVTVLPHIGVASTSTWTRFDQVGLQNLVEYFYGNRSRVTLVNRV